jgi:hypothetical protein
MYSNGGDLQGSSLFTYDDATDAEIFNATAYDFTVFRDFKLTGLYSIV